MSNNRRLDVSPGPQIKDTPGAYPPTPGESTLSEVESSQLSLSQAVYKRRAEYTVSRKIRIKIGTWNVAALHGTEKDIGSWFVGGKGVSESLSGLSSGEKDASDNSTSTLSPPSTAKPHQDRASEVESLEDVEHQEARRSKKGPTTPLNDPGFLPEGEDVGLYVLGLQEIVDVSSAAETLKPYNDPHPARRFKHEVEAALPEGYVKIAEQQLIGLFMVVYAAPDIAPTVSDVDTTSVGTGLMGYMGNKGAVVTRVVLGEFTRIVFVNCHLSAGVEKGNLERRDWDASQIVRRARFNAVYNGAGDMEADSDSIGGEDFTFWFGDLNYRLDGMPGDDVRRLLMLHTKNEYRVENTSKRRIDAELALHVTRSSEDSNSTEDEKSSHRSRAYHRMSHTFRSTASRTTSASPQASDDLDPSSDPASLQTTLASLLPHDQLLERMRKRKAFHDGWREGPIDFLPTYKYDVGSVGMFDSSEKKRGPSWCDRILFRTRKDKQAYEEKLRKEETAKRRDEEMKNHGMDDPAVNEEDVLFEYDPANDGAADDDYDPDADTEDAQKAARSDASEDKIHLEYYTSHQRVLSSDHKPLDAIFTLTYDAADPIAKARIHQDVARELDKAENERRPAVTVIVDHHDEGHGNSHSSADDEGVDFGEVRFDSPKTRHITVANTGRVPAIIGFTDRIVSFDQAAGAAPSWLRIKFDRSTDQDRPTSESGDVYTLDPGDAANVELTVHVSDVGLVRLLNDGNATIDDVLVLRVHNGRDYFLPVHGKWLQSTFGHSVDDLLELPEGGARQKLQKDNTKAPKKSPSKADNSSTGGNDDRDRNSSEPKEASRVKWSAPREIFRLTEAIGDLTERAVAEWGMRSGDEKPPWEGDPGWPFTNISSPSLSDSEIRELNEHVREALDINTSILRSFPAETPSMQRLEAVAQTLISFLASLAGGIITESIWARLEENIIARERSKAPPTLSAEDEKAEVLDTLTASPAHSTSFAFITSMLLRIIAEIVASYAEPATKLAQRKRLEERYAAIFAEVVIDAPLPVVGVKDRRIGEARRRRVVEVFL
ncbi:MAG: hypothetical protein LQ346_008957 [Caloplaca aetnensis]|nr:MAG: hypothetical protein LQ346_008957 [Caloplaca aetnensis]